MNLRRVLGSAGVFGPLLAYVIIFEGATPQKEEASHQEATAEPLLSFSAGQIREVRIASGPHSMRLLRKATGWETDPSGGHNIPPERIEGLINTLLETIIHITFSQTPILSDLITSTIEIIIIISQTITAVITAASDNPLEYLVIKI